MNLPEFSLDTKSVLPFPPYRANASASYRKRLRPDVFANSNGASLVSPCLPASDQQSHHAAEDRRVHQQDAAGASPAARGGSAAERGGPAPELRHQVRSLCGRSPADTEMRRVSFTDRVFSPPPQRVPAAATGDRRAHHPAALRPHEAEVQGVRAGADAAELEVLDRILMSDITGARASPRS